MICGAVRCGVTNKKYLLAADTKFYIRGITSVHLKFRSKVGTMDSIESVWLSSAPSI